ncbi:NlpC/P60 family protein [Prescottella sp. R16]|uniref:NlpC/P60 family protein n=1 Tax=Prescottella sp. R16 TaxID=3064529 RepID=UPI00272DF067|nr:NlpC/P60 family protein [Prescottella sp. R16]
MCTALATGMVSLALVGLPGSTAAADPVVDNPTAALERLADLSRESEQTTEALHNAQIDLESKQTAARDAEARLAADRDALDAARARLEEFRPTVNKLVAASYQGARTNRLFAVMTSDSPQQLLDQMSALDAISTDTSRAVAQFRQAASDARAAADASQVSADEARAASDQAKLVSDELQHEQSELQKQIDAVTAAFDRLTGAERAQLAGSTFPPGFDAGRILADLAPGAGSAALQAGLTQVGKPYSWGATGPDAYDCSGLVVWAYRQIGKDLPRSSQAQAQGGTPVDRSQLQPGDVVLFYDDVSHVGIYAGDGNVLHASTYGTPVKVDSMASMPFHGARRY